eukprot:297754-Prymnesium_polylepis.1
MDEPVVLAKGSIEGGNGNTGGLRRGQQGARLPKTTARAGGDGALAGLWRLPHRAMGTAAWDRHGRRRLGRHRGSDGHDSRPRANGFM